MVIDNTQSQYTAGSYSYCANSGNVFHPQTESFSAGDSDHFNQFPALRPYEDGTRGYTTCYDADEQPNMGYDSKPVYNDYCQETHQRNQAFFNEPYHNI